MRDKQQLSMLNIKKASVAELFSKFNVTLKEAWLNEVLEYLQLERADADIPTIIQLVYEQWLFSELSNSTRPKIRLPPFEKKTALDSDVVVQINWLVDIHTSMYSKLNQYVGCNLDNISFHWEPNEGAEPLCDLYLTSFIALAGIFCPSYLKDLDSVNRMYLMEVTDGQRKLRAVEYQKVDELCGKLSCGTKLLIYGGTICRRNVLLLTPNNMMILGGESETCQQNVSVLAIARRLGIDEKKLKLLECAKDKEYENSMKIMDGIETEKVEKIHTTMSSVLISGNVAVNSDQQQSANMRRTGKGENARAKKQKRTVLSRTITSYFQPQHKVTTSKLNPKVSTKSQTPLIGQEIKEELKPGYLARGPLQKQREMQPPPVLFPVSDSKKQSQHSIEMITFPQESNEALGEQLASPAIALSQVTRTEKIISDSGMQSELKEITGKSITMMHYQSPNVENFNTSSEFRIQPEKTPFSVSLWTRNSKTESSMVEANSLHVRKINTIHGSVILNGGSERKDGEAKPMIPTWSTDLQRNSADTIMHEAIISSSNIQEQTIWAANKWSLHGMIGSVAATPWRNGSASDSRSEASNVAFQPDVTPCRSGLLFSASEQNLCRPPVTDIQQNPILFHASQNSFVNTEPQQVEGHPMYCNTSLTNRPATLILPDTTLQIVPHVNIIQRYRALNIVSIREAYHQRRFCLVAHRKRVQPIFCKLHAGLQFIGQSWTAALRIADETCNALDCLVDNNAINNLIGFTPQDAQQAVANSDRVRVAYYKGRAQAMLETFKRLDLVLTIEFSSSSDILPLIVHITNLSTALGLC
uniref:RecQ-mediated genome instability protein 1 n=1 Tax=Brugia malayi TaxID=6279 RepID=A0A0H5S7Z3_BRUMA|nr:Bm488 [Brugia malayi]